ncbi:hypothetical protein BB934_37965 (plasmid) [Microvirga ossetica]|uniref:DUF4281 domain-containing protein n=1 Tax=Microvirga ossetica TaxID=1882682 RepID=A0A1B2EVQ6_9HYPH|nr:ABA4-like family protein [Microvirga ossetica]ANY84049.1 hypothetical protein BB934_37965 [Microvirga ossetica]
MPDLWLDRVFSLAGLMAMAGWLALVLAPLRPRLAQAVATFVIPAVIGLAYAGLIARYWGEAPGGFGSLDEVDALFGHRGVLLAGWLHYLAFDLFVGAWEVREARRVGLPHWLILPPLALTFLFGPIGLLVFLALRAARLRYAPLRTQGATA